MTLSGIKTREDLFFLLNEYKGNNVTEEEQFKEYKYVIYIRKSTDEGDKQVRSVEDQKIECEEHAKRNGLFYEPSEIIIEKESAKAPNKRPKFRKMLDDVLEGKYDGIIAWHPDRISRNMREAGEVIDMLDKGEIKDLQFPSFSFTNDTSGKTLLGFTFVMSKQYSDNLSDNVNRGNKRSLMEGKYINKTKHGYYKDEEGHLRADPESFPMVQKMFDMRLNGKSLTDIAKYANSHGHSIKKKKGRVDSTMSKQKVSKILRDPVYTGILVYGDLVINLVEASSFRPVVEVTTFMKINEIDKTSDIFKMVKSYESNNGIQASLMRGMVFCSDCTNPMTIQLTKKTTEKDGAFKYLSYRCDTKTCPATSVRAHVILDYIVDFLEKMPFSNEKAYKQFQKEVSRLNVIRISDKERERNALQAKINTKEGQVTKTKKTIYEQEDAETKKLFVSDLQKYQKDLEVMNFEKIRLSEELKQIKESPITYQKFIELWEKVTKTLKNRDLSTSVSEIDFYVKKLYLNFFIKEKSVDKSTLSSPFDILEVPNVSNGGR